MWHHDAGTHPSMKVCKTYMKPMMTGWWFSGFNLTVSIGGEGTGGVQVGAGRAGSFECQEAQCLYKSVQAMLVTVVAMPNQGSEFQGRSVADQPGVCSGTGSCQITMDRDVTVIATFKQP